MADSESLSVWGAKGGWRGLRRTQIVTRPKIPEPLDEYDHSFGDACHDLLDRKSILFDSSLPIYICC